MIFGKVTEKFPQNYPNPYINTGKRNQTESFIRREPGYKLKPDNLSLNYPSKIPHQSK